MSLGFHYKATLQLAFVEKILLDENGHTLLVLASLKDIRNWEKEPFRALRLEKIITFSLGPWLKADLFQDSYLLGKENGILNRKGFVIECPRGTS